MKKEILTLLSLFPVLILFLLATTFISACAPQNKITVTVKEVSFDMIRVEAGTFDMGATSEQQDPDDNEKPVHKVRLVKDYYIGKTEVTQALWKAVMGSNPSEIEGVNKPVECVSYNDCQEFVSKLNAATGKNFRLPTEAEWEFAARGGNKSKHYQYSGSNKLDDVAWYWDNSNMTTHDVATKKPNELGIYDMSGNVFELCLDWYRNYGSIARYSNPEDPDASYCVYRGGCWCYYATGCRSSFRDGGSIDGHGCNLGFRLVLPE